MLEQYKETFDRITTIEHEFANGCREHPNAISAIMLELAGHYTFLNSQKTELEVAKFREAIKIRNELSVEYSLSGQKMVKTQLEQMIDSKLESLVSQIMTLEGKLQNVDKLISVCQSSLKSIDREKRMPY